ARDALAAELSADYQELQAALETFTEEREVLWAALQAAVERFNDGQREAWEPVVHAQSVVNTKIEEATQWRTDIAAEMDEYLTERSEKWQESERGQAYQAWRDEYEEEMDAIELDEPPDIELEEPDEVTLEAEDPGEILSALSEAFDEA